MLGTMFIGGQAVPCMKEDFKIETVVIEGKSIPVVTSRRIAEDFEKRHADVLRDIEVYKNRISTTQFCTLFIESEYKASNGKMNKEYLLTRDGFSFLVMGFTGAKADSWKLKYIEAFNKMEEHIKGQAKPLSTEEMLELQFKYAKEVKEKVDKVDNRVTVLEERMTIETGAQKVLQDLVNDKVKAVLGGKDTPAYKELAKKTYSQCWRNFKNILQVASYKDTPVKDFDLAKKVIIDWQPNRELELMIRGCNAQMRM